MSRTDQTRPYWVQQQDPTLRHLFHEEHDHRFGDCDLGEYLTARGWIRTNCYIGYSWKKLGPSCRNCYCCGNYFRRYRRSQERAQWRSIRQRLLAGEEIDVLPIRGTAW